MTILTGCGCKMASWQWKRPNWLQRSNGCNRHYGSTTIIQAHAGVRLSYIAWQNLISRHPGRGNHSGYGTNSTSLRGNGQPCRPGEPGCSRRRLSTAYHKADCENYCLIQFYLLTSKKVRELIVILLIPAISTAADELKKTRQDI